MHAALKQSVMHRSSGPYESHLGLLLSQGHKSISGRGVLLRLELGGSKLLIIILNWHFSSESEQIVW